MMKMKSLLTSAPSLTKLISTPPHSKKPISRSGSPRNNIICNCRYEHMQDKPRHRLNRRHLLLASSVRLPLGGVLSQSRDQVSNLTDYRKLEDAQKLKHKKGTDIEVASSLFHSSEPCNGLHDEISGMVSVPSQHYHDFVEARVARPPSMDQSQGGEEELVIESIKITRERPLWFDVYIRPADVEAQDEYVGSFLHMPRHRKGKAKGLVNCCLRLGIGDMIDDVDPRRKKSVVVVTLAAKLPNDHNSIDVESIRIEHSRHNSFFLNFLIITLVERLVKEWLQV